MAVPEPVGVDPGEEFQKNIVAEPKLKGGLARMQCRYLRLMCFSVVLLSGGGGLPAAPPWDFRETAKLAAASSDFFGWSVAIRGSTLVASAPFDDAGKG